MMEKRIKFFFEPEDGFLLEKKVNKWLSLTRGKLLDIKYDAIIHQREWGPSIMLIYIPEEEKDEKESQSQESHEGIQGGEASQRKQRRSRRDKSQTGNSDSSLGSP